MSEGVGGGDNAAPRVLWKEYYNTVIRVSYSPWKRGNIIDSIDNNNVDRGILIARDSITEKGYLLLLSLSIYL